MAAAAEVWRHCSVSGGSKGAGAALPPRAVTVATKTPAATVMVGALPAINNQLNAAAAIAMEMATTSKKKCKQRRQQRQLGGSAALAAAAVRRRQCVTSTAAVGSSAAAMFPLFITHDEYFVRCGGSGGGGTMVFVCPAMKFFVDKNSVKYGIHTNMVPQKKCDGYKKQCQWTGP